MNLFEKHSQLNQLFTQSPVNAAYLAGSLSTRTSFGHLSDVDIAILLMEQIKSDQFLDYQLYFFSELAKRLESDSIDVVILNQASLLLKLQVIKYGQILFSRDEKLRVSFETKAIMDYLDFKKFDEIQNQALSRRLYGQALAVDKELVQRHLKQLRVAVQILHDLGKTKREEFTTDYRAYGLAERYLQVAIESCLQVCGIFVASLGLRRPEGYHELLSVVATQQIIPNSLAYRLEILTNLRDTLVHDSSTLNHDLLYDYIQQRVDDFEVFANAIEEKQLKQ
ncbi:MAG TPA: HepT-like ribonuclease domain-containing protein [Ktedonobacteraceae bacterium]|nr:HepT-like ribonuclease domain-containing protein [Ktedonobacteraceae bacterium]HXZ03396.1 HepT-like ribonuclease domain-containing protein [Ktedonobacteraceae bacterium]